MSNSIKTEITRAEYHQLIGLLALAAMHNRRLAEIEEAAREIVQELDYDGTVLSGLGGGHTGDAIYSSDNNVDDLLRKVGLSVEKEKW